MNNDEIYMNEALKEAEAAFKEGEVPVGAVIVYEDKIIGRGHNRREERKDISSHAEIEAIKMAEKNLGRWVLEGCTMYVTLEPCLMCAGAIAQARISRLEFGALDPSMGAIVSHFFVYDDPILTSRPLVGKGLLKDESSLLLSSFFKKERKNPN
jgi:tRNA(adenine34) deaminase